MGLLEEVKTLKEQGKTLEQVIEEIKTKYPTIMPIIIASIYYAV